MRLTDPEGLYEAIGHFNARGDTQEERDSYSDYCRKEAETAAEARRENARENRERAHDNAEALKYAGQNAQGYAALDPEAAMAPGNPSLGLGGIWAQPKNSFKTWWEKPAGAPLTDEEADIQTFFGLGELSLGLAGVFSSPAVMYSGFYAMADGGNLLVEAKNNVKASPGLFAVELIRPYQELSTGVPVALPDSLMFAK